MSFITELFYKKSSQILIIFFIFFIFFSANIHAEPKQRLIIHFNHPLNTENTDSLHTYLKKSGLTDYKLEEHSTFVRWIISLNTHIETAEMNKIKSELIKNKHINFIENDKLLQRK